MKKLLKYLQNQKGQAMVTLLFFSAISITIVTATAMMTIINSQSTSRMQQASQTFYAAQAGIQEAQLRLLRNPNYSGANITLDGADITITVTGTSPKTIRSTAVIGNTSRTIEAEVLYVDYIFTVQSWREVF